MAGKLGRGLRDRLPLGILCLGVALLLSGIWAIVVLSHARALPPDAHSHSPRASAADGASSLPSTVVGGGAFPGEDTSGRPEAILVEWLRGLGAFVHSCFEVGYSCPEDSGRCVRVRCNVRRDEVLLKIPEHLLLSSYPSFSSSPCAYDWAVQDAIAGRVPLHELMLVSRLIDEVQRGRASEFYEYIVTLPSTYRGVLVDREDLAACFAGVIGNPAARVRYRNQAEEIAAAILHLCNAVQQDSLLSWAFRTTHTRAFTLSLPSHVPEKTSPAMSAMSILDTWHVLVPLADLLNDALEPTADWSRNISSNYFTMWATKDLVAGTELTLKYGQRGNEELFTRYGFVHESNPYDGVAIKLDGTDLPPVEFSMAHADEPAKLQQVVRTLNRWQASFGGKAGKTAIGSLGARCREALKELSDTAGATATDAAAPGANGRGRRFSRLCRVYREHIARLLEECSAFVALASGDAEEGAAAGGGRLAAALLAEWRRHKAGATAR